MHYIDVGGGIPILLLHGNPTWSFLYRKIVLQLQDGFRCIAVDYPGFGLSDRPDAYGYTPQEHSRVIGELVDHLGLDGFLVMIQDWGRPHRTRCCDCSGRLCARDRSRQNMVLAGRHHLVQALSACHVHSLHAASNPGEELLRRTAHAPIFGAPSVPGRDGSLPKGTTDPAGARWRRRVPAPNPAGRTLACTSEGRCSSPPG